MCPIKRAFFMLKTQRFDVKSHQLVVTTHRCFGVQSHQVVVKTQRFDVKSHQVVVKTHRCVDKTRHSPHENTLQCY